MAYYNGKIDDSGLNWRPLRFDYGRKWSFIPYTAFCRSSAKCMLGSSSMICVDSNTFAKLNALRSLWGCPPDADINVNSRYNNMYRESARLLTSAYSQIASSPVDPTWHNRLDRGAWCLIPQRPIIKFFHDTYCSPMTDTATTATTQFLDMYSVRQSLRLSVDHVYLI